MSPSIRKFRTRYSFISVCRPVTTVFVIFISLKLLSHVGLRDTRRECRFLGSEKLASLEIATRLRYQNSKHVGKYYRNLIYYSFASTSSCNFSFALLLFRYSCCRLRSCSAVQRKFNLISSFRRCWLLFCIFDLLVGS